MPKQTWKINQFHGGLNSNSDPRDIDDNELVDCQDFMVDSIGKLRPIGGSTVHDSNSPAPTAYEVTPGYGLFHFSHDRVNGHLGENLDYGSNFSRAWTETGDFVLNSNEALYTHSTGEGYLIQTADNRLENGIGGVDYSLTYTVTGFGSSNITGFSLLSGNTEMITNVNNRDMGSTNSGATLDWAEYSPSTSLATYTEDTSTDDRIEIVGTSGTTAEGATLGVSSLGTLTAGRTYRVSAKVYSASDAIGGFKFKLGGVESEAFTITTSTTAITKDITAASDDDLIIFYENASTTGWFIDDVSVKEIEFADTEIDLSDFSFRTDGTHTIIFKSNAGCATQDFVLKVTSGGGDTEYVTNAVDQTFGSASNWEDYSPSTSITYVESDGTPAYLQITGTTTAGTSDATCDLTTDDATIAHDSPAKTAGSFVSGPGIPVDSFVHSSPNSTNFELRNETSGTSVEQLPYGGTMTNVTLAFSHREGAQLPTGSLGTIVAGVVYRVSAEVRVASGTMDNFHFELGGVSSPAFSISDSTTLITKDIKAKSDSALRIYKVNDTVIADNTTWFIDNVSVKEVVSIDNISLKVYDAGESGDDYLAIADDEYQFTVGGGAYNDDPTITHTSSVLIERNMKVSGTGIPTGAYVLSVTDATHFELSESTTGGDISAQTLTFTRPSGLFIYSRVKDAWSKSQTVPLGTVVGIKPSFYYVDGALRIGDGSFNKRSIWYGYINRVLFKDIGEGYAIKEWYHASQELTSPGDSYYDKNWLEVSGISDSTATIASGGHKVNPANSASSMILKTALETAWETSGGDADAGPVSRCKIAFGVSPHASNDVIHIRVIVKAGPYAVGNSTWGNYQTKTFDMYHVASGDEGRVHTFYFDPVDTQVSPEATSWVPGGSGDEYFRVQMDLAAYGGDSNNTPFYAGFTLHVSTLYEGNSGVLPVLSDKFSGGALENGYITNNNVFIGFDWQGGDGTGNTGADPTGSWVPASDNGLWEIGATFIYDGNQESTMTVLTDSDNPEVIAMNINDVIGNTKGTDARPAVMIAVVDPNHNGIGESDGTIFNRRITGCNIYMRDVYDVTSSQTPWFLQYSMDYETGILKVQSTQAEYYAKLNSDIAAQSYYYWILDSAHSKAPGAVVTYRTNTGYKETEKSLQSFGTAVVTNRMAYIGNVMLDDVVYGDRMMKSSVSQFDKFTEARMIDASVADGDQIVKLEEYADRILQFKKNKMHLINVSQELEFLEDTFMYKGIFHPAASCRTDFGIAWVNNVGCYLYDGQQVHNLFERDGRRLIDIEEWNKFLTADKDGASTALTPMIGYITDRRQLVIYDDITNTSTDNPRMYLYDMVTRSWIKGSDFTNVPGRVIDYPKSNFMNDWDGSLVYAIGSSILKWTDDADNQIINTNGKISIITKDFDFDNPALKKKIYRVRISYKGDGDDVILKYSINGDTDTFYSFINPDSGSEDVTPLADKTDITVWHHADLKPTSSSQANNIYSFQLHFTGGQNPAPNDFLINDITIIYRLKGVK